MTGNRPLPLIPSGPCTISESSNSFNLTVDVSSEFEWPDNYKQNDKMTTILRSKAVAVESLARLRSKGLLDMVRNALEEIKKSGLSPENKIIDYEADAFIESQNDHVGSLIIVFSSLPMYESCYSLGQAICDVIRKSKQYRNELLKMDVLDYGIHLILGEQVRQEVELKVATMPTNYHLLDEELHMSFYHMKAALASYFCMKYCLDYHRGIPMKELVIIIMSIRSRSSLLQPLSLNMIQNLVYYCLFDHFGNAIALGPGFRRFFSVLASGLLYLCSEGRVPEHLRVETESLTPRQLDGICGCAQIIMRMIAAGGIEDIINPSDMSKELGLSTYVNNGVVIGPYQPVD